MPLYLASKEYAEQLKGCHKTEKKFGRRGFVWGPHIVHLANEYKCDTVLDFGCGNTSFSNSVKGKLDVTNFDPGVPEYSKVPVRDFDMVVALDVMEHIEPERLDDVLTYIQAVCWKIAFFVIVMRECGQYLPDGRNTHINLMRKKDWEAKLSEYFDIKLEDRKPEKQKYCYTGVPNVDNNVLSLGKVYSKTC